MGLFDSLSGGLKSVLGDVVAAASLGGLQGIVEKLQAGG